MPRVGERATKIREGKSWKERVSAKRTHEHARGGRKGRERERDAAGSRPTTWVPPPFAWPRAK